nr:S-layer homology domain-containing protein [Cohnella fermenti]
MSSASSLSSVTWTVTNESDEPTELASIDQNGSLTAIGAGTVKVTVVSGDLTGSQLITINPLSAKLSATTATYYTNAGADITVTVTLNGNTLTGIKNGDTTLADTDYSVADATSDGKQVVTIKKSYLATLSNGDVLTFEFSAGEPAELAITVTTQQTNNPTPDPVTSTDPDSATDTDTDSGTDSGAVTQTPTPEKPVLNSAIANAEKIKSNVQQALQTNAAVHFPDVAATHWAAKAIEYASQLGIVEGAPNGEFKGSANVTRAEFAAMIVRAQGIDTTGEDGSFSDTTGHWADAVIRALHRAGIVNGTGNGAFNPDQEITRAEMAAILARVLSMSAANGASKFSDINGHWAAENIEQLNRAGIVDGVGDGKFAPNSTATRDQSVAIIMRMLNIVLDLDL